MKRFLPSVDDINAFFRQAWAIARKELSAYFSSPIALIFVGVFLAATLASFFELDRFFARNIADVRLLFRRMPALMIILVPALTMRQWSEEQRSGTLEVLLTLPARRASLVLGKFVAVVALVVVALVLTLYLPLTVSWIGDLDWGPVLGGYLAALLVASTYAAIGLFVSARTDNQIVALIVTVLLCVGLYGIGTPAVTGLFERTPGEILRAVGIGGRFESIERGVIDLRDLVYYFSLTVLFLVLNGFALDIKRWGVGAHTAAYRRDAIIRVALVAANLVAANVWLFPIHVLRADLTEDKEYSLSPVTRDLIAGLQEPLTIRAYISERTHPLLAPLEPTIRDMLREYEIASKGRVVAEVVDPRDDEALEEEANQVYGIRPVPFRTTGRYEDSVINSYFDILVQYGDQHEVLGFQDLIEVEQSGTQINVRLRNLEYDLTRSVKKVVYGFQSLDAVFAGVEGQVVLTAIVTPDTLPEALQGVPETVLTVAGEIAAESGGKFSFESVNPDAPNSPVTRQGLYETYGIQPFAVALFSSESYYLHLLLQIGDEVSVLYPGSNVSEADLRQEIESALKRVAPGFLKTVGVWHPSEDPTPNPMTGQMMPPLSTWESLRQQLGLNYTVKTVDLATGRVPGDVDVLVVVAPKGFTDKERFAVDQYLMRGGSVIVAAANFLLSPQQFGGGIAIEAVEDGLQEMLGSYGVIVEKSLVLDPQNEPFPIQVPRQVAGMNVVEIQQINYPFFVDVRRDGMTRDSTIVANLPAVTLQWASPVYIDEEAHPELDVVRLLRSSTNSWLTTSSNANPNLEIYPELGFPVEGERAMRTLAVSVRGSFTSYFKDRPSPFEGGEAPPAEGAAETPPPEVLGTIETSPESARLVVIGSGEFLDDVVLDISRSQFQDRYLNNLRLLENAVDWAVEDEDLLGIRSRGTFVRLLRPMERAEQVSWKWQNYIVALLGLVALAAVWAMWRRNEQPMIPLDADAEQGGVE